MLWVLAGYILLFVHRPFEVWPILGTLRLERIYMITAMLAVAFYPAKRWTSNPLNLAIGAFALGVLFCSIASPWSYVCQPLVEDYFKILVFYGMLVLVVRDERMLRFIVLAFIGSIFIYMAHSFLEYRNGRHFYRMGIARMIGVDSTLNDPNSFGGTLVYALPLMLAFWQSGPSKRMRYFLAAYFVLTVLCVLLTGSRSALITMLLVALFTIARSRMRFRLALLAALVSPLIWVALPDSLRNRFTTILYPEVGPANAQVSAEGRIEGLKTGFALWERYPLTGCGPGAWRNATGSQIESHNLYGQLVGEMGAIGVLTFGSILVGYCVNFAWFRAYYRRHPDQRGDFLFQLSKALSLSVILLLFNGNFGHNLFRYNWLWYGAFVVSLRWCLQRRESEFAALAPNEDECEHDALDEAPVPEPRSGLLAATS